MLKPNAQCVWKWGLWEVIRSWWQRLRELDSCPCQKGFHELPCTFYHVRKWWEVTICAPQSGPSPDVAPADALILQFTASSLWEINHQSVVLCHSKLNEPSSLEQQTFIILHRSSLTGWFWLRVSYAFAAQMLARATAIWRLTGAWRLSSKMAHSSGCWQEASVSPRLWASVPGHMDLSILLSWVSLQDSSWLTQIKWLKRKYRQAGSHVPFTT